MWFEETAKATSIDVPTQVRTPRISVDSAVKMVLGSPLTRAYPSPRIGPMRGAMSMAPITVAVEFAKRPKVAISVDRTRSTK